jgi:hypothetical protein
LDIDILQKDFPFTLSLEAFTNEIAESFLFREDLRKLHQILSFTRIGEKKIDHTDRNIIIFPILITVQSH